MKLVEVAPFLSKMRGDPAAWSEIAYSPTARHEDANWQARRACLLGLQHDRRSDDRDLVLHVLENEVAAHRNSSGCGSSLEAAVFFAAEIDDPTIAWRILSAKFANFDAACTIDVEALYSFGVERTLEMLHASDRPERNDFPPAPLQKEVEAWWSRQRASFPPRWDDEPDKVGTCREIGDIEAGSDYLRQKLAQEFAALEPGSPEKRRTLEYARYEWESLGQADEAAHVQKILDEWCLTLPWDRASALQSALATYVSAGHLEEAASKLEPLYAALMQVDNWRDVGLGRMSAGAMADLAISAQDDATAARVFTILEKMMADGLKAPPVLKEKLAALAARLGRPCYDDRDRGDGASKRTGIIAWVAALFGRSLGGIQETAHHP